MKITLIHPSRGRAAKAYETYNHWQMRASGKFQIEHILSLDNDDQYLQAYTNLFPSATRFVLGDNTCVVDATNRAAKFATGEILIYLSDDFKCPFQWDLHLIKRILAQNKKEWLLKVNDGLQPFEVEILTIPIMSIDLYKKLGYFWYPEYKSMFVDEDLYHTCKQMECIIYAQEMTFTHEHCSVGKAERDETYIRSEANWDQGKALFAHRKAAGFPPLSIEVNN